MFGENKNVRSERNGFKNILISSSDKMALFVNEIGLNKGAIRIMGRGDLSAGCWMIFVTGLILRRGYIIVTAYIYYTIYDEKWYRKLHLDWAAISDISYRMQTVVKINRKKIYFFSDPCMLTPPLTSPPPKIQLNLGNFPKLTIAKLLAAQNQRI